MIYQYILVSKRIVRASLKENFDLEEEWHSTIEEIVADVLLVALETAAGKNVVK